MHCLDYISDKPKFYIFKKETNKTNLGGLLFLLYIIIMLLISSAYIADYIINDKYTYDALSFYNYTTKEDEILLNEDNILNPYFNISLGLFDNEHLVVYDNNYNKFLESDEIDEYDGSYVYNIKRRVNDTYLCIFYICEDKNCSSYNDLIELTNNFGWIEVYYPNYQINHYDKIPVQKYEDESTIFSEDLEIPNTVGYQSWTFKWEVVKYKDQKSLFDSITKQQREYTFGHIKNEEPKKELKSIYTNTGYFMPFFEIISTNKHKEYLSYTRKKVDILDELANIYLPKLFKNQKSEVNNLCEKLLSINYKCSNLLRRKGEGYDDRNVKRDVKELTAEEYKIYQKYANDTLNALAEEIPILLKNEKWFTKAFPSYK